MFQIYRINFENGECYIGQTTQGIENRCRPCQYSYNEELMEMFQKYKYTVEVLETFDNKIDADEAEDYYIETYGNERLNKKNNKRAYYRELIDMKSKIKAVKDEVTIFDTFEQFIQEKEALGRSDATIRNYKMSFGIYCECMRFDVLTPIAELTQSSVYHWINHMRKNEISAASQNHYLRDFRTFINWCKSNNFLIEPVEVKEVKAQEEQPKFYKEEDLALLLEKPRAKDSFAEWRIWAIVNTILATGARAQTICDIQISDIDFTRKEIALSHTKNKKAQNVPLSKSLETCLREYIKRYELVGYLFPNIGNEKLTTNALYHSFAKYCHDRGVEQTNIHGLRHSFARSWVKNGGSAFALQRILGHSSLSMTNKYVKLYAEDIKEDYEDFSALDVMKKKASRTSAFKKK